MNPDITKYIENLDQSWKIDICQRLRQTITETVPEAEELKYAGSPQYKLNGKYICLFFAAKAWVNVTIFNATSLQAPAGFEKPANYDDRIVAKIKQGRDFDYDLCASILKQAIQTLS